MKKVFRPTSDQSELFGSSLNKAVEMLKEAGYRIAKTREEVKQLAINEGFRVLDAEIVNGKVNTVADLRAYFKQRLWVKYSDRDAHYMEGNHEQEMRAFSLFVKAREETGLNKYNAIQECVAIIDTIFDCSDEFNFDRPIDIRVIGQGKAGWITQKAMLIMNKKRFDKQSIEFKKRLEDMEQALEKNIDLKDTANKLDRLLANVTNKNGGK